MPDYRGSIVVFDSGILVSVPRDIIFTESLEFRVDNWKIAKS